MPSIAWALRKYHVPVSETALVLEIGSGGNPFPRSNVLIDAYEETQERHFESLVHDRPTLLGFGEKLPFKDKVFDFVIASHVLEHTPFPEKFLSEMQRVAKAGYIEVPDALLERVNPYLDHRSEITERNGKLLIRKKHAWLIDSTLVELYESRVKPIFTKRLIPKFPFHFHVRFFWEHTIPYELLNPSADSTWTPLPSQEDTSHHSSLRGKIRSFIIVLLRNVMSQTRRNKKASILGLIRCPECYSEAIVYKMPFLICTKCGYKTKAFLSKSHYQS
jgi:SAM-dependent methyltransferase